MPTYPLYPVGTGAELTLTRFYEDERILLTGQIVNFFVLKKYENVDPLYAEPYNLENADGWEYTQYNLTAAVTFQQETNQDPSADENGLVLAYDAEAFISYNEWQRNGPGAATRTPKIGDVIYCMGTYFDIVKAGSEGNLIDTVTAVGYKLGLKANSKFYPGRKTGNGDTSVP